eukprot:1024672-Prymnesium_polylepis.1
MVMSTMIGAAALGFAPTNAPWLAKEEPPSVRAGKLLKEMTLDEKLTLFHGSCSGYVGNVRMPHSYFNRQRDPPSPHDSPNRSLRDRSAPTQGSRSPPSK